MRNREDMNKYNTTNTGIPSQRVEGELSQSAGATAKTVGGMLWKALKTIFCICFISGILVFISVATFIMSFRDIEPPNLSTMSLNLTSVVYLDHDDGTSTEYLQLYDNENRVWVPLSDIPQSMQDAQIAIEDKRFMEHNGVDWQSTGKAVLNLFGSGGGGGGSTLTQQLIKNLTEQNQVSILRKVKEIFTALNMEKKYSKDLILQAYLNVVNYGNQYQGVQAAANGYFDKDIGECSVAECALIAGITQNPSLFNPFVYPDNAKDKAYVVLEEMEDQEKIDTATYQAALAEVDAMTFVTGGTGSVDAEETEEPEDSEDKKWNWYIDTMIEHLIDDLSESQNIERSYASHMLFNGGLEIHCAMNEKMQNDIENIFTGTDGMPADLDIEAGFYMMDYSGKVMAVVGSRNERSRKRDWNNATMANRQSGSAIKALTVYPVGLMTNTISYGSVLKDEPIPAYSGLADDGDWPKNFSRIYEGTMNVDMAVEVSQNAPAAWLAQDLTTEACFDFLTTKLGFTTLTEEDSHSISAMALGGQTYGVTVEEMTAAFQIYGNGGCYNEPYTYFYVRDSDNSVILDNRPENNPGTQVMTAEQATVMNKLLHRPTVEEQGTATPQLYDLVNNRGLDIYGKTGTTDSGYDLWFVAGTPFCVAGIWNGYTNPSELSDSTTAKITWVKVMNYMLDNYDFSGSSWTLSDNVVQATFCRNSGKLAGGSCYDTSYGWYTPDNIPDTCNGGSDHISGSRTASPSPGASEAASSVSQVPSIEPSVDPSIDPSIDPSSSGNSSSSSSEVSGGEGGSSSSGSSSSGTDSSIPVIDPTPDVPPGPDDGPSEPVVTPAPPDPTPDTPVDNNTPEDNSTPVG